MRNIEIDYKEKMGIQHYIFENSDSPYWIAYEAVKIGETVKHVPVITEINPANKSMDEPMVLVRNGKKNKFTI